MMDTVIICVQWLRGLVRGQVATTSGSIWGVEKLGKVYVQVLGSNP